MKILLACLNANDLGGSELYHYELAKELHLLGNEVTLATIREPNMNDPRRIILKSLGVEQIFIRDIKDNYDIAVASQPQVNDYVASNVSCPIVSIIHSEIRSEDPIFRDNIKHYITIRESIYDLIKSKGVPKENISLIYNPIDFSRFNTENQTKLKKTTGIFVGEVLDNIRNKAVKHLISSCIERDWDLWIVSESRFEVNHPNIKFFDKIFETETLVKQVDFTAGILLGRTTLEGYACGKPGYIYEINTHGDILNIDLTNVPKDVSIFDSKVVAKQHIELYNTILNSK